MVYFERCPIELPSEPDPDFLPEQSRLKNISYHPEPDSVPRFDAPENVQRRVKTILKDHRDVVAKYLEKNMPDLSAGWILGTTSFRAVEGGRPRSKASLE